MHRRHKVCFQENWKVNYVVVCDQRDSVTARSRPSGWCGRVQCAVVLRVDFLMLADILLRRTAACLAPAVFDQLLAVLEWFFLYHVGQKLPFPRLV